MNSAAALNIWNDIYYYCICPLPGTKKQCKDQCREPSRATMGNHIVCLYRYINHLNSSYVAGIWGWPFCLAFGGFFVLSRFGQGDLFKKLPSLIAGGTISLLITTLPLFAIDSSYYSTPSLPSWNLIAYNVLSKGKGPDLFGVEPWWFYFANLFLNFNITFLFALFSLPLLVRLHLP